MKERCDESVPAPTQQSNASFPSLLSNTSLANERTFLSYQRTSLALSIIGVVIAQLFRLQHTATPNAVIGYFVLGKPLAVIFQVAAIITSMLGAHRFWRQQMSMARGTVISGGWELYSLMAAMLLVSYFLV